MHLSEITEKLVLKSNTTEECAKINSGKNHFYRYFVFPIYFQIFVFQNFSYYRLRFLMLSGTLPGLSNIFNHISKGLVQFIVLKCIITHSHTLRLHNTYTYTETHTHIHTQTATHIHSKKNHQYLLFLSVIIIDP